MLGRCAAGAACLVAGVIRPYAITDAGRPGCYPPRCPERAHISGSGLCADFFEFPWDVLGRAATRIVNEVRGINRVVYDVTSKPPGTIEWE